MNMFLIDYENISADSIKNIQLLNSRDSIIIFYSEHCKYIPLDIVEYIQQNQINLEVQSVNCETKNALDFQLSTYLGFLIGNEHNAETYYIVSGDKGYDCICEYWQKKNVHVARIDIVDLTNNNSKASNNKSDFVTVDELLKYIAIGDKPLEVMDIFNQYKTKTAINNKLCILYKDSNKGGSVYKKLKPLFKSKNKS